MARPAFNNELAKNILTGIAVTAGVAGGVVLIAALPGLGVVLKTIMQEYENLSTQDRHRARATYETLRRARLISVRHTADKKMTITLSVQGKKKMLQYRFSDMQIKKPMAWDGKWRVVIFDLPKRFTRVRNLWRGKLKSLGFVQLQRSVWIHPYPCRDEIDFVSEYFRVSPHTRLLEVSEFDGSREYEEMFDLRK